MPGEMRVRIWDVEHGQCAMVQHVENEVGGRLAMIDSGCTDEWSPSTYIRRDMGRTHLDHLFITNADQDHMSDLNSLLNAGISVGTFYRNPSYTSAEYRAIKQQSGPLTADAQRYSQLLDTHVYPITDPFETHMGGITYSMFWPTYPNFTNTNDLSLAVFIKYQGFSILFPGDLEGPGWRALLQRPDFRVELASTTILVASHHGRESGFCEDVFRYCSPQAVVISDKSIRHETQRMGHDYRAVTQNGGVMVRTTGQRRQTLTTRNDGWIQFDAHATGYSVQTEYGG